VSVKWRRTNAMSKDAWVLWWQEEGGAKQPGRDTMLVHPVTRGAHQTTQLVAQPVGIA
jgi:hypothetical protein